MNLYKLISDHRKELMGFAALWILIFHDWFLLFAHVPGLFEIEYFIQRSGDCGVTIFFFLSGFGLVKSIEKKSTKEFLNSRLKRLIIPTIITTFVCIFVNKWTLLDLLKVITGIAFIKDPLYYLWFFYAILVTYLLFPFYYRLYKKTNNKLLFSVFSIVILLLLMELILHTQLLNNNIFIFLNRIPAFIFGVYFSEFENKKDCNLLIVTIVCVILLICGIYLKWQTTQFEKNIIFPSSQTFLPDICLFFPICYFLSYFLKLLGENSIISKVLAFVGIYSYELYCSQEIVQRNAMGRFFEQFVPKAATNFIIIFIELIIGYSIYRLSKYINKRISHS